MEQQKEIHIQRNISLPLWQRIAQITAMLLLGGFLAVTTSGQVAHASSYASGAYPHRSDSNVCNHDNSHKNRAKNQQQQNKRNQKQHGSTKQRVITNKPLAVNNRINVQPTGINGAGPGGINVQPTGINGARGINVQPTNINGACTRTAISQSSTAINNGAGNAISQPFTTQLTGKGKVNVINTPLTQLASGYGQNQNNSFICIGHVKHGNRHLYNNDSISKTAKDNKIDQQQKVRHGNITFICM